jgi:hypothetical protein
MKRADTIPTITFEASQSYVVGDINGQPRLGPNAERPLVEDRSL